MARETNVLGSAAIYVAANAFASALPLLLLPVMTRFLSPADFGIAAMFSVFVLLLGPLVGLSMKSAITARFFHTGERDLSTFLSTCLVLMLASAVVVGTVISLLREPIMRITHLSEKWLLLAVIAAAGQFVTTMQLTLLQARRMALQFGFLQVLQSAINAGLSLLLVVGLGLAWEGRVLGQVGALAAGAVIAMMALWWASDIAWPPRKNYMHETLAYALPLVPHSLGGIAILIADRFLITGMLDVEQTGIYTAALQIAMALGLLTQAFNRAYVPWLFMGLKQDAPGFRRRVVQGIYLYGVVALTIAAAFGLIAPLIADLLLGDKFHGSATFLPYLAAGFAFEGLYFMVANHILYSRQTKRLSLATILSGLANVLLCVVLIGRNGAVGAAQAFMLAHMMLFATTWLLAQTVLPMPWWTAFPWRKAD